MATFPLRDPGSTNHPVIRSLQAGNPNLWASFVEQYGRYVLDIAMSCGLDSADAEDVVQEVFLHLAGRKKITQYSLDHPQASFRGWLRTVVVHKACDYRRRQKQSNVKCGGSGMLRFLLNLPAIDDSSGGSMLSRAMENVVARVEFEFEPDTWRAFWRVEFDGLPSDCVAEELGKSRTAVYTACSRVRHRLREEFKRSHEEL